ncbi:hypothetical protein RB195_018980 [Necator americanus]|uniref:Folate-sensitive fragile site protein Fra10Ac1 n=1 Tax=Necator americanus TaxID=51031 RepID=A0ABR1CC08_NECAM
MSSHPRLASGKVSTGIAQISRMMAMNAYSRHKELINLYHLSYPGATNMMKRDTSKDRTDYDVLKDNHRFLWSEKDDASLASSWEARMARKYYDKLFKEYCIIDLTYFKKNKIAMRWRTEAEVRSGKGHFICGAKKCSVQDDLSSWEVNFCYSESGERKNTLVKVRLCRQCSEMLNYGSQRRRAEKRKKSRREKDIHSEAGSERKNKEESQSETNGREEETKAKVTSGCDPWTAPVQETIRTMDNEIDDFLDDLFD